MYLCMVLQYTIERLVTGALMSCDKPELRTKYGGTGKDVQPGADVQPRHLQVLLLPDSTVPSIAQPNPPVIPARVSSILSVRLLLFGV